MAEHLLKYGLKDGTLVSIDNAISGLGCECTCPSCGAALVARKGSIREHHFAHYVSSDCRKGSESALHRMAKHILDVRKELFVPYEENDGSGKIKVFSLVELESHEFPSFIPDVVMKNDEGILGVEILVTHAIDKEKELRISEAKLPTLEIDLSGLVDCFDEESVTDVLLSGHNTKWIYNSILDERRRRQRLVDEICDYLPSVTQGSYYLGDSDEFYDCLYQKKRVSMFSGAHSCHECWHFNNNTSLTIPSTMPCSYRERELLNLEIDDCRKIERKDGMLLSVEVLVSGNWQHWAGNANSTLAMGQSKEDIGNTVFELWKPEYSGIVVCSLLDGKERIINGRDGEMYTNQSGRVVGKYSSKGEDGRFHYSPKYYVVWGAEKPIWELKKVFKKKL